MASKDSHLSVSTDDKDNKHDSSTLASDIKVNVDKKHDTDIEYSDSDDEPDFINKMLTSKKLARYFETLMGDAVEKRIGKRLDYCEGVLHDVSLKVDALEKKDEDKTTDMRSLRSELSKVTNELNDLEQYGRRNNLRFNGFAESESENTNEIIKDLAKDKLKITLQDSDIDRSHRVGKRGTDKPRAILVKFTNYNARKKVIKERKHLKGSRLSIHEDLTKQNQVLLKETAKQRGVVSTWSNDGRIFASVLTSTPGKFAKLSIPNSAAWQNLPDEEDYKKILKNLEEKTGNRTQHDSYQGMLTRNRAASNKN